MKQYQARQARQAGTLIEVMIVVVIVGILMAIAGAGYQNSMRKARRADGMRAVMEMASRQERFYAQWGFYTTTLTTTAGLNFDDTLSEDGHYDLTATNQPCGAIATCYTVTATPRLDGAQCSGDPPRCDPCGTFSMNSQGVRTASGSDDLHCW